jgi:hypothetical protein
MQDGAPPHFFPAVQEFLNSIFLAQWIGQGGPTARPAHSPDLNPGRYPQSAVLATELIMSRTCNSEYGMDLR